ncbi:DNA/RNA non-specific endonuclease [Salinisphaera sp. PC39]|uniref:DNA/RNA non-specific endonuclease n=1 Tax=Salinisphaera sp. PC39 TaxID=1304156 RepID=UPI003340049A
MGRQQASRRVRNLALTAAVVLAAAALVLSRQPGLPQPVPGGAIPGGYPSAPADTGIRRLENPGFTVGYSADRGAPLWVAYRARHVARATVHGRPAFAADPRVPGAPGPDARVFGRGHDRGHMAPNYLIANLYGRDAQRASFRMTNITPQRPRLNQLLWQRLEEIEADNLARHHGGLWVTVGPIYDEAGATLPAAFYRIWTDATPDGPRALALRVPQDVRGDERLDAFVVSVDRIEAETGLDFHPALAPDVEKAVEAVPGDAAEWGLAALACFPARYREDWQGRDGIRLDFERCD